MRQGVYREYFSYRGTQAAGQDCSMSDKYILYVRKSNLFATQDARTSSKSERISFFKASCGMLATKLRRIADAKDHESEPAMSSGGCSSAMMRESMTAALLASNSTSTLGAGRRSWDLSVAEQMLIKKAKRSHSSKSKAKKGYEFAKRLPAGGAMSLLASLLARLTNFSRGTIAVHLPKNGETKTFSRYMKVYPDGSRCRRLRWKKQQGGDEARGASEARKQRVGRVEAKKDTAIRLNGRLTWGEFALCFFSKRG